MNETKPQSACQSYKWHTNAWKNESNQHPYQILKKPLVELTASFNAVVAYHPLRTIGIQVLCGTGVNCSPTILYRGFMPGLLGAHQLFLMGLFQQAIKGQFFSHKKELSVADQLAVGALAGALTTTTMTPLEVITTLKQSQKTLPNRSIRTLYRGIAPMFLRQTGLGAGVFYLPSFFSEKFKEKYPEHAKRHCRFLKVSSSIAGGVIAAAATQQFEITRTLMQNDITREKYLTFKDAFKESFTIMKTPKGAKFFGLRLSILAVTSIVINTSRDICNSLIEKGEPS